MQLARFEILRTLGMTKRFALRARRCKTGDYSLRLYDRGLVVEVGAQRL